MSESLSFDGTLVTVPFASGAFKDVIVDHYRQLLASYDSEDILVITGTPTSMETVRDVLDDELPGVSVPWVTSLIVHATDVMNHADDRTILSDTLRRELVHRFLEEREWDSEYFQQAAEQPSFRSDIASLMETATWQRADFDSTPELVEVGDAVAEFHEWLDDHDHIERGQLISEALAVLTETERRNEIIDADAVLVVEFEEFLPLDRQYLAALTDGLDLVCIAETDASVRRTWVEPGPITDHVSFSNIQSIDDGEPTTQSAATAAYLTRGTVHEDPETGDVSVIEAESADEQFDVIADEIERLRDRREWAYDDFAIALKQSGSAVTETIRAFQQAGIPTE